MTSMRYGPVQLSSPPGFQNILRLISQEVLRVQPENTLVFIAAFVKDILEIRENTGYDPVMQGDMIERIREQYHKLQYERQGLGKTKPDSVPAADTTASQQTETSDTLTNDAVSQTPTIGLGSLAATATRSKDADTPTIEHKGQEDDNPAEDATTMAIDVDGLEKAGGDDKTSQDDTSVAPDNSIVDELAQQDPTDE